MTTVEKIILKHYGNGSRFKNRGWEQCGNEIQSLIRAEEDKIKDKGLHYIIECDAIAYISTKINKEYESFFEFGRMYDWINGNESLRRLLAKE